VLGISARAAGTDVVLRVADRGPGIPADEQPRVFDKFYRGRAVRAGGSGLGLTIAARIVHAHGGSIGLESTAGEGTTVTVTVPFVGRAS
jgi:signal transduction histidine kinase